MKPVQSAKILTPVRDDIDSEFDEIIGEPIWVRDITREYLIEPILEQGVTTQLSGEAGGGKSWVALDIACAIAQGRQWAGLPTKQAYVLYLDRENSDAEIQKRLTQVLGFRPSREDAKRLRYWGSWCNNYPEGPDSQRVIRWVQAHPGSLVIFDSQVRFNEGEENSASDNAKFFSLFDQLRFHGATVLVLHHTGKNGATRGSSDGEGRRRCRPQARGQQCEVGPWTDCDTARESALVPIAPTNVRC